MQKHDRLYPSLPFFIFCLILFALFCADSSCAGEVPTEPVLAVTPTHELTQTQAPHSRKKHSSLTKSHINLDDLPKSVVVALGVHTDLPLPTGQQRIQSIDVGNSQYVDVQDFGSRLRITGRKVGTASLQLSLTPDLRDLKLLQEKIIYVYVLRRRAFQFYSELRHATESMRGVYIDIRPGPQIVVRGRLLRLSDWIQLSSFAHQPNENHFYFEAEIDPLIKQEVQEYFEQTADRLGLAPTAEIDLSGPTAQVRWAATAAETGRDTFLRYGFNILHVQPNLRLEPMVRVRMLIAEVQKSALNRLGVEWPSSQILQFKPGGIISLNNATQPTLELELQALEQQGQGRILASPNLLCRSGKEAEFLAGGEIPIKNPTAHKNPSSQASHVTWKPYGIQLKIKPLADRRQHMSIELNTEVSLLDDAHAIDGIPAISTRRLQSHFDMVESKTIALSGLIQHESGHSTSGLPALSEIPIIGKLFSSQSFRERKSELVIFVTPEWVSL